MIIAGVVIVASNKRLKWCWWMIVLSLCTAFLLNQHRLQPWAYQSAIYSCVFACLGSQSQRRWLILIGASIYLFSGLGKLDYQFAHTVGQDFLGAVKLPWVEKFRDAFDHQTLAMFALVLPLCEVFIGIGLLVPQSRRIAGCLVILFHLSLIGILGPWNLGHSLGVLCWNGLLTIQAYHLFVKKSNEQCLHNEPKEDISNWCWIVRSLVLIALVMPITERYGHWDHWTSWALYSPHTSRAEIEIHTSAVERIPRTIRPYLSDEDGDHWHRISLANWSLDSLHVPIYPQSRYQLHVADILASRFQLGNAIRVTAKGISDRWTGHRSEKRLLGEHEIHDFVNNKLHRRRIH